jgi:hypothetical protein
MFLVSPSFNRGRNSTLALLLVGTVTCIAFAANASTAQRRAAAEDTEQPAFTEFKGVRIGMKTDEARKKLGNPTDKSPEQDIYFTDTQTIQIFYDKTSTVTAISIDFQSGADAIPSAREVLGGEATARDDGSIYKMLRYPKAGYWVSYSRTAGKSPTTTVTMQKIEH